MTLNIAKDETTTSVRAISVQGDRSRFAFLVVTAVSLSNGRRTTSTITAATRARSLRKLK
jgi:hypothetical protein